jgi:uncharacterized membrane protein YidH (DUF202 family)
MARPPRLDEPRDAGLQAERTGLAWSRTALAMFVNAVLILRAGVSTGVVAIAAVGGVLFVAALAATACGIWRRDQLMRGDVVDAASPRMLAGVALATLLGCAGAIASMWVGSS